MRTLPNFPITPEIEARFWSHVNVIEDEDSCWEWQGSIWHRTNAGTFFYFLPGKRLRYKAYRVGYAIQHGEWPKNLVCHTCDNPKCVRGSHLFDGTHVDNGQDMSRKGRGVTGDRNVRRTHPERTARGERHGHHILTEEAVIAIRAADTSIPGTKAALARQYGVTSTAISEVVNRRNWKHIP